VVQRYAPESVRQVIGDKAVADMIEALKTVPRQGGTAPDAAMKNYVVAGKTGTAQKAENGAYASGKYISSFIGFFPADDPQICISVVMDEPKEGYYGGKVCGPVFRDIAERCASYLNIPPDPKLLTNAPSAFVSENGSRKTLKQILTKFYERFPSAIFWHAGRPVSGRGPGVVRDGRRPARG
jgi:membrane peptidoglycan carboxypeptidase